MNHHDSPSFPLSETWFVWIVPFSTGLVFSVCRKRLPSHDSDPQSLFSVPTRSPPRHNILQMTQSYKDVSLPSPVNGPVRKTSSPPPGASSAWVPSFYCSPCKATISLSLLLFLFYFSLRLRIFFILLFSIAAQQVDFPCWHLPPSFLEVRPLTPPPADPAGVSRPPCYYV